MENRFQNWNRKFYGNCIYINNEKVDIADLGYTSKNEFFMSNFFDKSDRGSKMAEMWKELRNKGIETDKIKAYIDANKPALMDFYEMGNLQPFFDTLKHFNAEISFHDALDGRYSHSSYFHINR